MSTRRRRLLLGAVASAITFQLPGTAVSQLLEFRDIPTVSDFETILNPEGRVQSGGPPGADVAWREIRNVPSLVGVSPSAAAAPPVAAAPGPSRPRPVAITMPDVFAINSDVLPPRTVIMLDNLAGAMRLAPRSPVLITGHTDNTGSLELNDALSQRRADAAARYLLERHGVDKARVQAIGVGPRQPLSGVSSASAQNRRIQVWGR